MTTTVEVIVAGVSYSLSDEDPFFIESIESWGMAPGHLLESRGAEQHGATYNDFRLDPRDLELIICFQGDEEADLLPNKRQLISIFQRRADPILLRFTFDDASVRQIDCRLAAGLSFGRSGTDHDIMRAAAVLRCPDPTFYDPAGEALTFELGGGSASGVVPTPVPTDVGASTIAASTAVTYAGTWRSQPTLIRITGPITEFVLTNQTTGDDITAKAGVTIAAGDWYDIDCRYGAATVVDSLGANKIANITDTSELTTFAFLPDPDAPGGINVISLTGSGVTSATQIEIAYYERYLGA